MVARKPYALSRGHPAAPDVWQMPCWAIQQHIRSLPCPVTLLSSLLPCPTYNDFSIFWGLIWVMTKWWSEDLKSETASAVTRDSASCLPVMSGVSWRWWKPLGVTDLVVRHSFAPQKLFASFQDKGNKFLIQLMQFPRKFNSSPKIIFPF